MDLKINTVRKVKIPQIGTEGSAGIDFFIPDCIPTLTVEPKQWANIPSGIIAYIPKGYTLVAFNKSGRALEGLQVGACVIDSDYLGEIHLHVHNIGARPVTLEPGTKLVQFILLPYVSPTIRLEVGKMVEAESSPGRRTGGFGSTGLK